MAKSKKKPLKPSISSSDIDQLTREGGREGIAEDEKLLKEHRKRGAGEENIPE